jgi:hypothetical protein
MKTNRNGLYIYGAIIFAIILLYTMGNYVEGFQNDPPVNVETPTEESENESNSSDEVSSSTDTKPTVEQINMKLSELSVMLNDIIQMVGNMV